MSSDICNLNTESIENNLFAYSYHSKYLKKLHNKNFDKEDVHYISTYSSFVGEVYENVIYELLLQYAVSNHSITKFVLKGPHQNGHKNEKNGLLIDKNDQIVYKSGYKDVSEFDGLFFTKDELWFVESTIVKATASLKKRLKKKKALLKLLFPDLTIRALIILSHGVMGANTFPSYCTVWVTKQLEDTNLISKLIESNKQSLKSFVATKDKKLIQTKDIKIFIFKYFETLSWILKKTRENKINIVDIDFLNTEKIKQYFDIFSKLYIGFIELDEFKKLYHSFDLENIDENKIIVTIEKNKDGFLLIYYAKQLKGKLKKIEILNNKELKISDKDPKGFTASETKFMKYIWRSYHKFYSKDILNINNFLKTKEKKIYLLSDKKMGGVVNLPIFEIKYLHSKIDISRYDALIFTSKNGVFSLNSFDDEWKKIPSFAISHKTANCIKKNEGNLRYTGKNGHGDIFAKELISLLREKKVLYIKASKVVSNLIDILKENSILCDELITYETICKTYKKENKPPKNSIIILSSPSTLNCFLDIFDWDESYTAVAIGKTTAKFIPDFIEYKIAKHTSLESCIKLAKTI